MLNKECGQINSEKKIKFVERSAKKGIMINEKDVNLLAMQDVIEDESDGDNDSLVNNTNANNIND